MQGAGTDGSPQQQAKMRATTLKFARCMRDHGIKDFPDRNATGGVRIAPSPVQRPRPELGAVRGRAEGLPGDHARRSAVLGGLDSGKWRE